MESKQALALKALAERSGLKDLVIVSSQTAVVPSTGKKIFRYQASRKAKPNDPPVTVALDESNNVVDLVSLSAREGVTFFAPPVLAVPVAPLLPAKPITINPTTNDLVLHEGETFNETITVTVPKDTSLPKADVYLLADTTGSMSSIIASVQAGAAAILGGFGGLDVVFGVGNYKDFPIPLSSPYAFQHQLNPTSNLGDVTNAINAWAAADGSDGSEAQFFALDQLAEPPGGVIGWRTDSKRIIVWFGDAPGHDPICAAMSGLGADITEASVTAKLVAENITVLAISTVTGYPAGLDDDPASDAADYNGICSIGGAAGQASRIATATGGSHTTGINAANIVTTILDVLEAAVGTINNIRLVPAGATAPFVTSISPPGGYGPLKLDVEHVLTFKVQFTGVVPCKKEEQVFFGTIDVVADSVVVAQKKVKITVPPCQYVYSVKFVCGEQHQTEGRCASVRPGFYSTEINIHNFTYKKAVIEKRVYAVVIAGEVVGREPKFVRPRAQDKIVLPPHTATMDDCCRIAELLFPGAPGAVVPITIGFLEIVSNVELNVTAVYTASDLRSNTVSIDVEQVKGKLA